MSSEDEAWDPWPGCAMTRTGCHWQTHRSKPYLVGNTFAHFFGLPTASVKTLSELDDIIIGYAEAHNGADERSGTIHYDEALWIFFQIEKEKPFRYYHIERYIHGFITEVKEAPVEA